MKKRYYCYSFHLIWNFTLFYYYVPVWRSASFALYRYSTPFLFNFWKFSIANGVSSLRKFDVGITSYVSIIDFTTGLELNPANSLTLSIFSTSHLCLQICLKTKVFFCLSHDYLLYQDSHPFLSSSRERFVNQQYSFAPIIQWVMRFYILSYLTWYRWFTIFILLTIIHSQS